MDAKPLIYHPNRTLALYRRPELMRAQQCRMDAIAADRNAAVLSVLEMATDLDEDEVIKVAEAEMPGWDAMTEANHIERAFMSFWRRGRQVFDVSRLVEPLKQTDVDAIVPHDLPLPFDSFYLHFGECGLPSPFLDAPVDGCYVERWDDEEVGRNALVITAVCRHPHIEALRTEPIAYAVAQQGRGYVVDVALDKPVGIGLDIEGCDDVELWAAYMKPVVRLAMNAICYLAYPERDVETDFQPGTPGRLVEQAKSPRRKEAQRAESKLADLGYTRIHFCGRHIFPAPSERLEGSDSPRPHWRRGHWRNQAHGLGRRDHKLIWIAPTMVRADLGEPEVAHVYEVASGTGLDGGGRQ